MKLISAHAGSVRRKTTWACSTRPVEVWRSWAGDVRGQSLASGHHMAEEVSEQVKSALLDFMQTKAQRETEAWRYR